MPFTFAHPAAVLPFVKKQSKYISVTALILGSMAPDFEYFLHFRPYGVIGHTWLGFLYLNLPLVFLLAYIYHYILKKPFITNLPKPFAGYYTYAVDERWRLHTWKNFFVFCYSALFGMLTHVVWDALLIIQAISLWKYHFYKKNYIISRCINICNTGVHVLVYYYYYMYYGSIKMKQGKILL